MLDSNIKYVRYALCSVIIAGAVQICAVSFVEMEYVFV